LDFRIAVGQSGDSARAEEGVGEAIRMQHQIWEIAVANARKDLNSDIGALFVESVNQIADLHALRVNQGLQARISPVIWSVLYALLILGMMGLGYETAIADSSRSRVSLLLAASFSLVIALIAALDDPMNRIISVSHEPLVSVQTEIRNTPDPAR
jgi:hypothetical protein